MILIGLGANKSHPEYGPPLETLTVAIREIGKRFLIRRQSSWYRSAPVPMSDQPWFVNGVIAIETELALGNLLGELHEIEGKFGRERKEKWGARVLDLDILVYHDLVTDNQDQTAGPVAPHPRVQERAFVLAPLAEIASEWRHPLNGLGAAESLQSLPEQQEFEILPSLETSR